jgi:aldose 1-epimerase
VECTRERWLLATLFAFVAQFMSYGATLVALKTPDRAGHLRNIVLGFDSLTPYLEGVPYFGSSVGRYANRIANARFKLDGKTYQLIANDGPNTLHGGPKGFDKRLWTPQTMTTDRGPSVGFTYVSPAGEDGFPGQLTASVRYTLADDDTLTIDYRATTTAPTPVNLTNHAYFNLTGDLHQSILHHILTINADRFTPVDSTLIPTGELRPVTGTPFEFRTPHVVGSRIGSKDPQMELGHGYDHNWVLNKPSPHELTLAAVLHDPKSGRVVEVRTTQPGIQFYTGNWLDGKPVERGKGTFFAHRTGLCLETQHFPDSPNQASFPSTILRPGQLFREDSADVSYSEMTRALRN